MKFTPIFLNIVDIHKLHAIVQDTLDTHTDRPGLQVIGGAI
jgi:hypothetical protein